MASIVRLGTCALFVLVTACGESNTEPKTPTLDTTAPPPPAHAAPVVRRPITSIRRSEVKATIEQGPGYFLQNFTLDDWPVMRDGKFHGFKIASINEAWGIDLKAGDVVTRVNGVIPEKPDDAFAALQSLQKAKALKVDYERNGLPRVLELPIVD